MIGFQQTEVLAVSRGMTTTVGETYPLPPKMYVIQMTPYGNQQTKNAMFIHMTNAQIFCSRFCDIRLISSERVNLVC